MKRTSKKAAKPLIGFIGQGYIGKNYANDFERRGYPVVRYALEEPYVQNKDRIRDCDIVFVAVPTPTTPKGFDASIVRQAIGLVGKRKIAVIKSTVLPGTAAEIQRDYADRVVLYSPEFLSEATAARDAAHPFSNIIGVGKRSKTHTRAAQRVHAVLPRAKYSLTCDSTAAEIIKYAHNGSGFVEIVFFNLMYNLARSYGLSWDVIQQALEADPYIAHRYARPVHKTGRGAGGHCFIKDFAALRGLYTRHVADAKGKAVLRSLEAKNRELLEASKKDLDLLNGVYGKGRRLR